MKKLTNLITAFSAVMAIQATSMAKLLVTPTRIDLNNSNKVQALKLINESNEEVTYRIGYMYQNMNADGSYTKLTDEEIGKRSEIEKMVMYSPRQVTLEPKQTQTVRFALRRKEGATGYEKTTRRNDGLVTGGSGFFFCGGTLCQPGWK